MPILKMVKCDVCGKIADFWTHCDSGSEPWFIVNISHVYCSEECFNKNKNPQPQDKE